MDFRVYVSGPEAKNAYFFEETASEARFFSRGNEFSIVGDFIRYKGTGGSFCEYMFGVEKALKDLVKKDILNRLVMFGAFTGNDERLIFTDETDGFETAERLFLLGHAVKNYYFLVSSPERRETRKRQRELLGKIGKFLKRTAMVQDNRDSDLVEGFLQALNEPSSTLYVFKLVHKNNGLFYDAYRETYFKDKGLGREEELYLAELAVRLGVDYYQQERIKIDIMYRHPENRPIVDQHRDILVSALEKGGLEDSDAARLRRIKTLRIRNRIPSVLFETLDELLLKGKSIDLEDSDSLREPRSILENMFFKDPTLRSTIIKEDIVRLIRAKHKAYTSGDMGFDQMLLDVGKICDETARETGDYTLLEELSSILTYFDRYDHIQANMSQLAFRPEVNLSEDTLRSLIGNKKEFDQLDEELFDDIFAKELYNNRYVTGYGKRKIIAAAAGIDRVIQGDAAVRDVLAELRMIGDEEKLYWEVHDALKEQMRTYYAPLESREGKEEAKAEIERVLARKGVAARVPDRLFEKCLFDLKKELFYVNQLLPVIIKTTDTRLREDFIRNSGLDRFYIENVEKAYFEDRGMDKFLLELLKEENAA